MLQVPYRKKLISSAFCPGGVNANEGTVATILSVVFGTRRPSSYLNQAKKAWFSGGSWPAPPFIPSPTTREDVQNGTQTVEHRGATKTSQLSEEEDEEKKGNEERRGV